MILLLTSCSTNGGRGADLDALAAEMLPRIEVLSGLTARAPIELAWQNRDELQRYVREKLDEELPEEYLRATTAAYAAFGLVPDTLDLHQLLLDLYSEQVVGYYDPEAKTLYVMEGAPSADIRTVLSHELVHALQDQHVDLDSLISRSRGNDRQTAAQAAFEGHATLVMFALLFEEQMGRPVDPLQIPPLGDQLATVLDAQNSQFPVFQGAPRLIRETLIFPYIGGAAFVQALWNSAAEVDGAGDGIQTFPAPLDSFFPESTEQVLHPETHLLARRDHPTEITLGEQSEGWGVIDEGTLGELEVGILLREHLGPEMDTAARGWDGDLYRLVEAPGGERALVWYSVWDDATAADRFAVTYRRVLGARPERRGSVERMIVDGRQVVLIIDAEKALNPKGVPVPEIIGLHES